ncbi:MAG TPA: AMP-binding protein, partial [Gemmatimonadales bacterium]|nr:AMP-binding protein [Gemmatimonadales bacterium]
MSRPATLNQLFFDAMERFRDRPAMLRARRDSVWTDISTREVAESVHATSLGLLELGVQPGDRVAILSENRPEWAYTDLGILTARAIDVPVYATLPAAQIEGLLRDSGSEIVFVSNRTQLEKIGQIRDRLPDLREIIAFDDGLDVTSLRQLMIRGREVALEYPDWREN